MHLELSQPQMCRNWYIFCHFFQRCNDVFLSFLVLDMGEISQTYRKNISSTNFPKVWVRIGGRVRLGDLYIISSLHHRAGSLPLTQSTEESTSPRPQGHPRSSKVIQAHPRSTKGVKGWQILPKLPLCHSESPNVVIVKYYQALQYHVIFIKR